MWMHHVKFLTKNWNNQNQLNLMSRMDKLRKFYQNYLKNMQLTYYLGHNLVKKAITILSGKI